MIKYSYGGWRPNNAARQTRRGQDRFFMDEPQQTGGSTQTEEPRAELTREPVSHGRTPSATGVSGTGTGTGGQGQSSTDAEVLQGYLDTLLAEYTPEPVEYDARTADEIAREITEWLRPGYDAAIEAREAQTDRYHAELDADALARGMGASTFVTDVKGRQNEREAADVASMEADYSTSLIRYVSDAVEQERARALEVELFNSEREQEAYLMAYEQALSMFALYKERHRG